MKYRQKPVVVEARQLFPEDRRAIARWVNEGKEGDSEPKDALKAWFYDSNGEDELYIETPKGPMCASEGDWIIKNNCGELHICEPDVFAATYEPDENNPNA